MRTKFIAYLVSQLPVEETDRKPIPPNRRPVFRSSHRGPGARYGKADPEMVRQLVLSINQHCLLASGGILWAGIDLIPFIATLPKEVSNGSAKI
ncbi:MAG: hypothetical protein WCT54_01470 [Patescibacteria group bacterium]